MSTDMPEAPQEEKAEKQETPEPIQPQAQGTSNEVNTMAMLCHLLVFAGFIVPFGNIIGPLVIWLMKKDLYPLVNDQGKESLNFQISVTIAGVIVGIVVGILTAILNFIPVLGPIISILLYVALGGVGIYVAILVVRGAMAANQGVAYRYPYKYEFIK